MRRQIQLQLLSYECKRFIAHAIAEDRNKSSRNINGNEVLWESYQKIPPGVIGDGEREPKGPSG